MYHHPFVRTLVAGGKIRVKVVAFSSTKCWTPIVYQTPPTATVWLHKKNKNFLIFPGHGRLLWYTIRLYRVGQSLRKPTESTEQHFYAKLAGATDRNWQNSKNSWQSANGATFLSVGGKFWTVFRSLPPSPFLPSRVKRRPRRNSWKSYTRGSPDRSIATPPESNPGFMNIPTFNEHLDRIST